MQRDASSTAKHRTPRQWRSLIFFCVTLALCVSLASRTVDLKISDHAAATSATQKAKIQHLDKDAFGWTSPVSAFAIFLAPAPHAAAMVEEPLLLLHTLDAPLYNRPPPVA